MSQDNQSKHIQSLDNIIKDAFDITNNAIRDTNLIQEENIKSKIHEYWKSVQDLLNKIKSLEVER
jgi:hypothetical protein